MELSGFFAYVTIEGNRAKPHGVEVSADKKTATCWIISEAGKTFSVHWEDFIPSRETSGRVFVDGINCRDSMILVTDVGKRRRACKTGKRSSSTTIRPFTFSVMGLTDDDACLPNPSSESIGDIVLKIWRASVKKIKDPGRVPKWQPQDIKVHEHTKKAIVHQVKFGVEMSRPKMQWSATYLDKEPLATFVFKYRSLDILRANGIISIPLHSREKRKVDDTDIVAAKRVKREKTATVSTNVKPNTGSEEIRLLEDRLSALRAEEIRHLEERLKTLRSRQVGGLESRLHDIKTEQEDPKHFVSGDVIDLT